MPRRPRLFVSGGIYHVYCRTHRGEFRFGDKTESRSFIEAARHVVSTHGCQVLAWCLLTNHYHLALKTADVKLWRSMARIHGRVTRQHNRRKRVFGAGWQGRYRARLIQDGDDLRHLLAYIHLNPVMAGIVKAPVDYRLSGHRAIVGKSVPILTDIDEALRCYGGESKADSLVAYIDNIKAVLEVKTNLNEVQGLPWWEAVGDDHQTVEESVAPPEARTFDDRHPTLVSTESESIEVLLSRVARHLGVSRQEIVSKGKRKEIVLARLRFTLIAVHRFNHSLKSVAELLRKSSGQVSRWLGRETEAYYSDERESCLVDEVTVAILQQKCPDTPCK
jgi:REP element-mobilizing transposase RayT